VGEGEPGILIKFISTAGKLESEAEIGYAVSSLSLLGSELITRNPNWQLGRLYPN
jgi:hypothetical protein